MYHVKNDKRSQSSAHLIYQGLIKLSKHKTLKDITISAICEESGVSRATFYRNFDIIEDILIWRIEDLIKEIVIKYQNRHDNESDMSFNRYAMRIGLKEHELLKILNDAHRIDLIENIVYQFIENNSLIHNQNHNDKIIKYALASKIGSFFGILECWLSNSSDHDINELLNDLDNIAELASNLTITI